jgi:aerobic carbon-monoxide dehydrogenase large subunit
MVTPAAVSSAIDDALKPIGVRVKELPATPERVLGWIEDAKA